jgi:hypothetical protein
MLDFDLISLLLQSYYEELEEDKQDVECQMEDSEDDPSLELEWERLDTLLTQIKEQIDALSARKN